MNAGHVLKHLLFYLLIISAVFFINSAMAGFGTLLIDTCDDTGMPLGKVLIELVSYQEDVKGNLVLNTVYSMISDNHGRYSFNRIHTGIYTIKCSREGFSSVETDTFELLTDDILNYELRLTPLLQFLDSNSQIFYKAIHWSNPGRYSSFSGKKKSYGSDTVSEFMERDPGIMQNPETGQPLNSSSRTFDVGLYLDQCPLFDPADHRPAFYPPFQFLESIRSQNAGFSASKPSFVSGNMQMETRQPGPSKFGGELTVSEIVYSDTFLDTAEADRGFQYWNNLYEPVADQKDRSPKLTDRRAQLLLSGKLMNTQLLFTGDYRDSNRGYCSDYVNEDALEEKNAWLKASYSSDFVDEIVVLGGYLSSELQPANQWILRGLPAILTQRENVFGAVKIKNNIKDKYWYEGLLTGVNLTTENSPDSADSTFKYPYGLGRWYSDSRRESLNMTIRSGLLTERHSIEVGSTVKWLKIDIKEGFEADPESSATSYDWLSKDEDYEFSLWGQDRWFLYSNIEIGLGIRWDRLNYLNQADYLSPRIYAVLNQPDYRLIAGVERVIQSPGLGFVSDETIIPINSDVFEPVKEPQQGFRWFGSCEYTFNKNTRLLLNSFYTLMSRTVVILPIETEPGIEFIVPAAGQSGRFLGAGLDFEWKHGNWMTIQTGYSFSRSRLPWGDDVKLSILHPIPEMPWNKEYYDSSIQTSMPLKTDLTHALHLECDTVLPSTGTRFMVAYRISSGLRYTHYDINDDGSGYYDPETINDHHGSSVHRLDLNLEHRFPFPGGYLICHLSLKNALNQMQYPQIDPFTGKNSVDPYRLDYNQPRTLVAALTYQF